jgi:hypothetical protein
MKKYNLINPEKLSLSTHPELNEKWVQDVIAEDPGIIGLGDLVLKDKERIQPKAGRLDLLFQDADTNRRYEVELQLGKVDESHIIRTIEYWDLERKRYPQYDHCAVIIAEDITSRFLNVISLFNGHIPLIAIQMNAYKLNDDYFLTFTTVIDELNLGLIDADEEISEITDRNYWEVKKGSKKTVAMADKLLEMISEFAPGNALKYNKFYIGLAQNGVANNFAIFRPRRNSINLEVRIKYSEQLETELEEAGLDLLDYDKKWGKYRLRLNEESITEHQDILKKLLKQSYGIGE